MNEWVDEGKKEWNLTFRLGYDETVHQPYC